MSGAEARAQFANHSIGFEAGGVIIGNPQEFQVGSGGGLGVNSTLYLEKSFELYVRLVVSIHNYDNLNVVGLLPSVGFRYLFSEDTIRPYLGLTIGYLAFFTENYINRGSLGPMAGIEAFVGDNFSVGLQAEYQLMAEIVPQFRAEHAFVLLGKAGWYF